MRYLCPFIQKPSKSLLLLSHSNTLCTTQNGLARFHEKTADLLVSRWKPFGGQVVPSTQNPAYATACRCNRRDPAWILVQGEHPYTSLSLPPPFGTKFRIAFGVPRPCASERTLQGAREFSKIWKRFLKKMQKWFVLAYFSTNF